MTLRFKRLLGGFALAGVLFTGLMAGTAYSQATASTTTGVVYIREIISGSLSFASGTNLKIDSAGVQLSGDGDGALTFLGLGNGSDEDLTMNLDDTANTIVFTSSTGANAINMTGFALTVDSCTGCGAGGAATTNTYITQTAAADLSAEQILASLSTGIMRVATTTGVITSLTDSAGIFANISDETGGTGVLVGGTSPVFTTNIDIGTTGVRLSDDGDGALTFLGLGNGTDEAFTINLDDFSNSIVFTTSTGATTFSFSGVTLDASLAVLAGTTFQLANIITMSATDPTVASGFCTSPTITSANGTFAFLLTIGTSCTGVTTGTLTLPTASTGWVCMFHNVTSPASFVLGQTGGTTTTVTVTNYSRTTGLATDFTDSEVIRVGCHGY